MPRSRSGARLPALGLDPPDVLPVETLLDAPVAAGPRSRDPDTGEDHLEGSGRSEHPGNLDASGDPPPDHSGQRSPIYRMHLREPGPAAKAEPDPGKPAATRLHAASAEEADVRADRTVDDQVTQELVRSDEENLLKRDG